MSSVFGSMVNIIFTLTGIAIFLSIAVRIIGNTFLKEKTVFATITDMQCCNKRIYRKKQVPFSKIVYTITFLCDNKNMSFDVSGQTYSDCQINQSGVLKYKGTVFLDFTVGKEQT